MITNIFSRITHPFLSFQRKQRAIILLILVVLLLVAIVMPQVALACGQGTGGCHCPGC